MVEEERRSTRQNTIISNEGSEERRNVLREKRANTEMRRNFFSLRVVKRWNELPEKVKAATSVNMFKDRLDKYTNEQTTRNEKCEP